MGQFSTVNDTPNVFFSHRTSFYSLKQTFEKQVCGEVSCGWCKETFKIPLYSFQPLNYCQKCGHKFVPWKS